MRERFQILMRMAVTLCCAVLCLAIQPAYAQTAQADPSKAEISEETTQALAQGTNTALSESNLGLGTVAQPQTIDMDDPALIEALEARQKADRAIAEAVAAQKKNQESQNSDLGELPAKKSLIPTSAEDVKILGKKILDKVIELLTSIPFLAQIGAIVMAYLLAPLIAGILRKKVFLFNQVPGQDVKLKIVRDYVYRSREFLKAVMLVALLALFAIVMKSVPAAGQDWLVKLAQGLAVVFLLYKAIKTFIPNELVRKLATWIVIPLAVLGVFGYFDDLTGLLKSAELMRMGDTPITLMTVVQLAIFGTIFFKLGGILNNKGQTAIRSQESLDSSTVEVVSKIFQILLFGLIFILVMGAAKVPMSGLVMIFSALSLGIGLGLQPVAANFVSGMIILFDRSVRVGDFVSLEDGREGFVEAINMRSTTVETTDGKDIMVPNTTFIENAYENWTHKDPRQRYEVYFTVPYDTDIDLLEDIVIPEISNHPSVLQEPEEPDLELREFGPSGINFAIEFWCSGIDDGPNKFTSDLNFSVWRILKKNNIRMPLPQTEVRMLK